MRKVDHGNLSFWAAGNNGEGGLGLMERQRVKVWTRKAYEQFDRLDDSLFCRPVTDAQTASPAVEEPA
jgi:hypothetical protein